MDKAILRQRDVLDLLGVSRATLTNWRNAGTFPPHIQLGPRIVAWRRADIEEWIASR